MSEQHMRQRVVRALRVLDAVSVENPAYPGTPDVNYVEGWIELKWMSEWPRKGGVLEVSHFTPQQRVWLQRRVRRGGRAWLLLQVGNDWMLFRGDVAAEKLGREARAGLVQVATRVWENNLVEEELVKCLA